MLYALPLIGAFIGWLTNYLAVKMLFHPKEERKLFFVLAFHGVFPKRQKEFAARLAELVSTELISLDDVREVLAKSAGGNETVELIEAHIEKALREKFSSAFPVIKDLLPSAVFEKLRGVIREETGGIVDAVVKKLGDDIEESFDIHGIVEEKVSSFSTDKLEEIIHHVMKKEFQFIELVGAVVGFIIGTVQVAIIYWSPIKIPVF